MPSQYPLMGQNEIFSIEGEEEIGAQRIACPQLIELHQFGTQLDLVQRK